MQFSVWAPNAQEVSVIGDFNSWEVGRNPLEKIWEIGSWTGFIPSVSPGNRYKFAIRHPDGKVVEKSDPFAALAEVPPKSASVVWTLDYAWSDESWMKRQVRQGGTAEPISIYELHLGSWMRHPDGAFYSYGDIAERLVPYVKDLGFTHVELLPITEHPLYESWGYQTTGYFSPTSRYGTPQQLCELVNDLHRAGIGVILDWVPAHFPVDEHGLALFDGTPLYEHADHKEGYHPDWQTLIFNYGRNEVANFLISSAMSWFDRFHIDGIRVDAVASMLYRDYSRKEGEWIPNQHGGRENLEAIEFLKRLNEVIYAKYPAAITIAEESTAWPKVSRPTSDGGLGFGYKWNMGWMNDTLRYFSKDPVYRKHHHNDLTFGLLYAFSENFVLPLSHDEVVHGKGSLLSKCAGDDWQKFANLRLLYSLMFGLPGKKLLFMGSELAPWQEWNAAAELPWGLLKESQHSGVQNLVKDLNLIYRNSVPLHELDCDGGGFKWIECNDSEQSILSFLRLAKNGSAMLCILNFTPVVREHFRVPVQISGSWREVFNSDAESYGGSGVGNGGATISTENLILTLPPLGAIFLTNGSLNYGR